METNKSTERKEIEKKIKEQEWFGLLPNHTKGNLLSQPSDFLNLLLKQKVELVTTADMSDFTFGFNTITGKPIIRIPEFSATEIGVAKLNLLNLQPQEKMRFIIENRSLMERPLSYKKKKLIAKLLKKIGDLKLWELGALVEEKTRDIQLRIETGEVEMSYLPRMEISQKRELPQIILTNYLWLWQEICSNCKRAEFHGSISPLCFPDNIIRGNEEKPPISYQICYHPYGRKIVVSAIGPFSALKSVSSFPLDDPDRFEFWKRKWDHWPDANNFSSVGILQIAQRRERTKKPEILEYICPKCDGKGTDPETVTIYERRINSKGEFVCWRCDGVGWINKEDKGNPRNRFFDALKYIEKKGGVSANRSMLNELLPHTPIEVWHWSSLHYNWSGNTPVPLIRKVALPVSGMFLEIQQQIVREDPIYSGGDQMGVTDDVEVIPIKLTLKKNSTIEKPEEVEFQEEAKELIKKWEGKK